MELESPLERFHSKQWILKPQVPNELYTDRAKHLNFLYEEALAAGQERARSTVLLGQRRMGKTEIFYRVINRLFWKQDHLDPKAVIPVHYRFSDSPPTKKKFAIQYVENFLRWWAAFRLRDPQILLQRIRLPQIKKQIKEKLSTDLVEAMEGVFNVLEGLELDEYIIPEQTALLIPKEFAEYHDTVVMFLDEFQNVNLPQHDFRLSGLYQPIVESLSCPHFVTGSAMSILAKEILGSGALFGRFRSNPIEALTLYHGAHLAQKAAAYYRIELPQTMAPLVAQRCGGNPFYITAVLQQSAQLKRPIHNEEILDQVLAVDLSSGFIWAELNDQVTRWIERVNDLGGAGLPMS